MKRYRFRHFHPREHRTPKDDRASGEGHPPEPASSDPPPSLAGPHAPHRAVGYRLGRYAASILGWDGAGIRAEIHGSRGPEGLALAEGIALGCGCQPTLRDGAREVFPELRCIFTCLGKRVVLVPRPFLAPKEVAGDPRMNEDFASWLLSREDPELFEVRFV